METGLIYIFTGDGKGKTSAGLGVAIRCLTAGLKVAIVQWYKQPSWRISEHDIKNILTPEANTRFAIHPLGEGFFLKNKTSTPLPTGQVILDQASPAQHRQAARKAYQKALSLMNHVDVLILDEINNALNDGLLNLADINKLLSSRKTTHLVLTGRYAHPEIMAQADLVTDMTKLKHPFDQGKLAVKGLDY